MAGHALWTQYEARRYSLHCSPCWSERQDLKQPQPRDSQHLEAFWKQETAVRGAGSLCADWQFETFIAERGTAYA